MRRHLLLTVFACSLAFLGPFVTAAVACPMCKAANDTIDALPRAYQASILFMLGVPMLVATGFGIGFYRLSRNLPAAPTDEELAAYDWHAPQDDDADPG
jgi:hypothetical protein